MLNNRRKRRGSMLIELLFALPIALIVLLAMIEFSQILAARQQLQAASREGARVAALGGDPTEAEAAARQFLGTGNLAAATVVVGETDSSGQPIPTGGPVYVIVSLPTGQAVPDLLAWIGFSIRGDTLIAETVMRKE
jgi:Flp pilus assembly protein TadG